MSGTPVDAGFVRDLRHALQHLYDAGELRKSPLLPLLGVARRDDPATWLRRLLLQAISALKPPPDVPAQAGAWRTYQLLSLRYVEQYSQREVGADLSLSIRQVRREDSRALHALAEHLWLSHSLHRRETAPASPERLARGVAEPDGDGTPSREQEMEWLRRSSPSKVTEVGPLIEGVLKTVAPLAQSSAVALECTVPTGLPALTAQQPALRQALLNVLTAAVRCAGAGTVSLRVWREQHKVHILVSPPRQSSAPASLGEQDRDRLEMAAQLARLAGGELVLPDLKGWPCAADLTLPAAEQVAVLVVDDNADTLKLMQRYLAGTRYRFAGTSDPMQVLATSEAPRPDIVLLDVMLPGVDGWELLERLREHPATRGVPIIVCTILPQEELALSLGAAAFLRKPVSRQALLAALDRQLGSLATESV